MAVLLRKALQGGIDVLLKNAHVLSEIQSLALTHPTKSQRAELVRTPGQKHFPIVSPFQLLLPLSSLRYHPRICIEQWTDKRATGINMRKNALDARFKCAWKRGHRLCHNMQQHTPQKHVRDSVTPITNSPSVHNKRLRIPQHNSNCNIQYTWKNWWLRQLMELLQARLVAIPESRWWYT